MKIGIVTASLRETKTLLPAAVKLLQTYSLGPDAWVIAAGMGVDNAIRAAEWLLSNGADALLSWGLASGLNPVLPAGSVLLPPRIKVDRDCRLPGKSPNLQYVTTDKSWRLSLLARLQPGFSVCCEDMLHSDRLITGKNAKQLLYQQSAPAAVDMASAAVGWVARQSGIPFVAARVVADPGDMVLPPALQRAFDGQGRFSPVKLLPALLLRPQDGGLLLKFALHSRTGLATLRRLAGTLQADFAPEKPVMAEALPPSG